MGAAATREVEAARRERMGRMFFMLVGGRWWDMQRLGMKMEDVGVSGDVGGDADGGGGVSWS